MKITILTDNTPCSANAQLIAEHGLSLLVEHEERKILCDMGLNTAFYQNASLLQINLQDIDTAFVSHGHKDHSGGLMTFLTHNNTAPVYLSPKVFHQHFFTKRHADKRDISTDSHILDQYQQRLRFVSDSEWIGTHIACVKCTTHRWAAPLGNAFLTAKDEKGKEHNDDFSHELALAWVTPKGLIIISSCSHNGALNIMQSCKDFTKEETIYAFIGGLHFVDCNQTAQEVEIFQKDWNDLYPDTLLFTGHCTSDKAKLLLKDQIPHLHIFHTGENIQLNL